VDKEFDMNTLEAIAQRRSIRQYRDEDISEEVLRQILTAATQAPSGKNRQPWHLVVVRQDKRTEMVRIMREAIARMEERGDDTGSSKWTANVMEQAPVTIFVFNSYAEHPQGRPTLDNAVWDIVDGQSIGAAIQNMLLAAWELGIGSLWICDVFYAYQELCTWLGQTHQMIAAVSFGYPDETPGPRPRRSVDQVTEWI
jgi:nitroreductase